MKNKESKAFLLPLTEEERQLVKLEAARTNKKMYEVIRELITSRKSINQINK
jgi:hypothetical protein